MKRSGVFSLVALLMMTGTMHGQDPIRISDPQGALPIVKKNLLGIMFERSFNTFNWIGRLGLDTTIVDYRIGLQDQYTSNIILQRPQVSPSHGNLTRTQHLFSLSLARPVTKTLHASADWSSHVYSDDKAVGLSSASAHRILGGAEFTPSSHLFIRPMAGFSWDDQGERRDKGLSYQFETHTRGVVLDGYNISGAGQFREDRLDPRLLQRHFASLVIQKQFLAGTRDSLALGVSRNRREFYQLSDGMIESRVDNVLSFSNILDYEIDRNFLTSMFVTVNSRFLDKDRRRLPTTPDTLLSFDTAIEEFRLDLFVQATYRSDDHRTLASARLSFSERDESHRAKSIDGASQNMQILHDERNRQEQSKDNISRRTSLLTFLILPLSASDVLSFSGAASILRYDTPSDRNLEERDELLVALSLTTSHHLSRYLHLDITLEGTLSHLVYLLKERSANNNINRILRLSPRLTYRPVDGVVSANSFEVLANYTVYDFEEQASLARSFSYRQFVWFDSTSVDLTRRIGVDLLALLKVYERGELKWSAFAERTENSFVDQTYSAQIRCIPRDDLFFAVGLRFFSQTRFVFKEGAKLHDSSLRSVGPTSTIHWQFGSVSTISVRGWFEKRREPDGTSRSLVNISSNILLTL